ncbi:MAG: hydroxyacylglutathione hydrolase [Azonexus sp.]|jgi:hydroxyacylglutathione hydrolase|nr:hydroxyacylglutathione hydrolase [Azonexus sp.]
MFEISFIPAFKDNYIWLLCRDRQAVVVDPGDAAPVLARLAKDGLTLAGILITHHHADHQGGVGELTARALSCPPVPVFAPASESITGRTTPLDGGERLLLLGETVEALAVPGHTAGHLAYLAGDCLFCGDTLFGAGCGRLFEGTPGQMAASLATIAALPPATRIYCAHEYTEANLRFAAAVEPDNPAIAARAARVAKLRRAGLPSVPSTLAEELATNPFLRCREPAVIEAARQHGAPDQTAVAVFAALRGWRNGF